MKIIIKKEIILNGVKFCNSIIGQNIIYPVLQSLLIEVKNSKISLKASNGTSSSIYKIFEGIQIFEEGTILIKARTLLNIISKLDNEDVLLEKIDNSLLKIKSGRFDSNINIMNVEEYPNLKFDNSGWETIILSAKQLFEISKKVSPSVNTNIEKESIFNGILIDSETEDHILRVIASDTFKLSLIKYHFNGSRIKMIIEPSVIKTILDIANDTQFHFFKKDNKVIIKFNNVIISTRNIEGNFPSIDKIINQDFISNFKIDKYKLQNVLNRGLSLIINDNKPIANFKINKNDILISFKSNEIGSASETIEIESNNIDRLEFEINVSYLITLLKPFEKSEITFYISDINKPIIMKDENDVKFTQILVPLRKN
ncbi:MAG: DNA polymerase III subunit beta [Mycoplasmoidaceae bacterium]